jgi:hypothetical protein
MTNQNQLIHLLLALALPVILLVAAFLYTHNSPPIAHAAATISVTGTADDSTVRNLRMEHAIYARPLRLPIQTARSVNVFMMALLAQRRSPSISLAWAHTPLCSLLP